jgi:excisionase family DNA binding protein
MCLGITSFDLRGPHMTEPLYTPKEIAAMYRKKPSTIRKWIRTGILPALRIGRSYLINEADVLSLVQATTTPQQASA